MGSRVAVSLLPDRVDGVDCLLQPPNLYLREVLHRDIRLVSLSHLVEQNRFNNRLAPTPDLAIGRVNSMLTVLVCTAGSILNRRIDSLSNAGYRVESRMAGA